MSKGMNVNLLPVKVDNWHNLDLHPFCSMFPAMVEEDYESLVESIKHNGFLESDPIVLIEVDGEMQVLDGRNRLNAAFDADVTPPFVEYTGEDPLGFVMARNMDRRHLTTGQKAALAAHLTELGKKVKQADAAKALGIGEASIRRYQWVAKHAPEIAEKVASGEVPLEKARAEVRKEVPKPERFRDKKKRELEEQKKAQVEADTQTTDADQPIAPPPPDYDKQIEVQATITFRVGYKDQRNDGGNYPYELKKAIERLEKAGVIDIDIDAENEL